MIVPDFWAEARAQSRAKGKSVTMRRFGWSVTSQDDAQRMADERAQSALSRMLSGERLAPQDFKVPYNGAQGLPIREQVVSRHGAEVITRNSYGALCLNSPGVLIADVDLDSAKPLRSGWPVYVLLIPLVIGGLVAADVLPLLKADACCKSGVKEVLLTTAGLSVLASTAVYWARKLLHRWRVHRRGDMAQIAQQRVEAFVASHPDWGVRIYATPAGLRLFATHRTFDPLEPAVTEFFNAVQADPVYVTMCRNQHCFRARLTAKPWRMGMHDRIRPRPGVWPVNPDRLEERTAWLALYDVRARAFAACRYVRALGNPSVAPEVADVVALHDDTSRALRTDLALA